MKFVFGPHELAKFKPTTAWLGIDMRMAYSSVLPYIGSSPFHQEAAMALAAIAPQDPEVIAALLEDLDPRQSGIGEWDTVAALIHHSTNAHQIFEQAVQLAGAGAKSFFTGALPKALNESQPRVSVERDFKANQHYKQP